MEKEGYMRKILTLLVGIVFLAVANLAGALDLKEGKHYKVLSPERPVEAKDKIEVTEFFWYGCGHCFNLEPILSKWLKTMPKDVTFRRVPAVFPTKDGRPGPWAPLAQLYYTLESMGLLEKMHGEVFDAIHIDRVNLNDPKVLADWLAAKGVDRQKFSDTFNSFAVQSKVTRAQQLSVQYGFDGVPAIFVNGRYGLNSGEGGSHEEMTAILDQLIDKARKERSAKK
jgi:protein dithiol oxidoreductase (disulfide-forming)